MPVTGPRVNATLYQLVSYATTIRLRFLHQTSSILPRRNHCVDS